MELTPRRVCNLLLSLLLASCVLPWAARAANNPVPLINTPLVPTSVAPGGAGFTLTVNGTGFVSGATINWNGTALTTTFVSGSQLTATVPAGDIATAGTAWVTVTNPAPGGGTSLPAFLRIAASEASPSFTSYSQGMNFYSISPMISGDFNGDGKLDLAFIGDTRDTSSPNPTDTYSVCIALGNGNGSFQAPVCQQAAQGQFYAWIVAGDFNGDGKLDLAVTKTPSGNTSGVVSVYLGNGDGTLQSPINSSSGNSPGYAAAGDFNKDGKLDLAIVNVVVGPTNEYFISVLLGNGDGTFQSPVTYASGLGASSLVAGDFNGDGNLDIVFADADVPPYALYFMAGNGDGTFQTPQQGEAISQYTSGFPTVADFNGDGKLDLFLQDEYGSGGGGSLPANSITLGNGDGTFQAPVDYSFGSNGVGTECYQGAVDDLNADGKLDLAFCQGNAGTASVVGFQLGNGDGTFQAVTNLTTPPPPPIPQGIVTGDFNGDGRVDIVTPMSDFGTPTPGLLFVFLQGSFPVASATPTSLVFQQQAAGSTSLSQSITLTNTGTLAVTLSGVSILGTNATDFAQTNTCGATLAGGASCQITSPLLQRPRVTPSRPSV